MVEVVGVVSLGMSVRLTPVSHNKSYFNLPI